MKHFRSVCTFGLMLIMCTLMLGACMYPQEQRIQNQPPHQQQIQGVQDAVHAYQQDTGVLPIVSFDEQTPSFLRYAIDFDLLIPRYLPSLPESAFEAGGIYRYVLVRVEEDPTVKLVDLRHSQTIGDVQRRLNIYLSRGNYIPVDRTLGEGYVTLDAEALGITGSLTVRSPYTQQNLPLIVDNMGRVGIDYRIDIQMFLMEGDHTDIAEGEDLRFLLYEESTFVPGYSFPVVLRDGEPHLQREN